MIEVGEEEGRMVIFDFEDVVVYMVVGLIVCGVVCMVVGYIVFWDYIFNLYVWVCDMEVIEIYYVHFF